jgi:hypothetical protein
MVMGRVLKDGCTEIGCPATSIGIDNAWKLPPLMFVSLQNCRTPTQEGGLRLLRQASKHADLPPCWISCSHRYRTMGGQHLKKFRFSEPA